MENNKQICHGCVYYPPNLPESLYSEDDWDLLQSKECSFDTSPGESLCESMRKGSCPLVSLDDKQGDA